MSEQKMQSGNDKVPGSDPALIIKHKAVFDLIRPGGHRVLNILMGFLLLVVGFGIYAYIYQLKHGLSATGLGRPLFWGLYMTNFVFFIGISHAGTLISAILRVVKAEWRKPITRAAEVITVIALCIGAPQILFDLGRIDRVMNVIKYGRFQSPILWDITSVTIYLMGSILFLMLPLIPDIAYCRDNLHDVSPFRKFIYRVLSFGYTGTEKQEKRLHKAMGVMTILIIPIAVSVHTVVSWIFSMTIQPMWHSTIFGPYFVTGAIFSGIAALIIALILLANSFGLKKYFTKININNLALLEVAMTMLWAYFTLAEHLTVYYGSEHSEISVLIDKLSGNYAFLFWLMIVSCFVIPIIVLSFRVLRSKMIFLFSACLFILLGMWLERFLIVTPTLSHPRLPYLLNIYSPSWVEWAITAASFAMFIFLYLLFARMFPIIPIWEMEGSKMKLSPKKSKLHEDRFGIKSAWDRLIHDTFKIAPVWDKEKKKNGS